MSSSSLGQSQLKEMSYPEPGQKRKLTTTKVYDFSTFPNKDQQSQVITINGKQISITSKQSESSKLPELSNGNINVRNIDLDNITGSGKSSPHNGPHHTPHYAVTQTGLPIHMPNNHNHTAFIPAGTKSTAEKNADKRERNKMAARRCRQRKMDKIKELRQTVEHLSDVMKSLKSSLVKIDHLADKVIENKENKENPAGQNAQQISQISQISEISKIIKSEIDFEDFDNSVLLARAVVESEAPEGTEQILNQLKNGSFGQIGSTSNFDSGNVTMINLSSGKPANSASLDVNPSFDQIKNILNNVNLVDATNKNDETKSPTLPTLTTPSDNATINHQIANILEKSGITGSQSTPPKQIKLEPMEPSGSNLNNQSDNNLDQSDNEGGTLDIDIKQEILGLF